MERDSVLEEQHNQAQRELEQREVRFRVIEEFLNLRGQNEVNTERWKAILAEGFSLLLPSTTFQDMVVQDANEEEDGQVLTGVEQVVQDTMYLASFLQTLAPESKSNPGVPITLHYNCDRLDFMMDGCNAVLGWTATSVGAVSRVSSS